MKKLLYISTFIIILMVSFLSITYSYEYNKKESLKFELIGPEILYIDVNSEYKEYGITVINNGIDISSSVNIDSSLVDMTKLGNYQVKYSVVIDDNEEYIYRDVKVIDMSSPTITLKGNDTVYMLLNGKYVEEGYTVKDNYDTDLEGKVKAVNNIDASKEGTYTVIYTVSDNSGNKTETSRKVIVKKPVITLEDTTGNRVTSAAYNAEIFSNTIIKNNFTSTGIYYEGYIKEKANSYKIKLKSKNSSLEYLFNMTISKDNYYKGNLDLTMVKSGEYDVYIVGNTTDKLLNKLYTLYRIVRAKVGNKLVTIMYDNDVVTITIDDFKYEYDFFIDPGHGGAEIGASNGIMNEKDLNLKVSLYEKCRYESMGYKVYMSRYNDTYGELLGPTSLSSLQRRAMVIGYYGAVSKIVYSNHHNGSIRSDDRGFEMLVSNKLSAEDLIVETSLYNKYRNFYGINDYGLRLYSRDYNTEYSYNKASGMIYNYTDYYAVLRIPSELFNVKNVIYEPIYLSSSDDFNWYYANKNWIKVSEMKIEEYVNYLGGTYVADNSSCL